MQKDMCISTQASSKQSLQAIHPSSPFTINLGIFSHQYHLLYDPRLRFCFFLIRYIRGWLISRAQTRPNIEEAVKKGKGSGQFGKTLQF
jgi:hypothetical protein